ncbi:hypothetical protein CMI43_00755 [Candidatus Pacearchaeota archaeon]|jgi:hypothetical protein|nr:hypothetical protein [Candidatus Pacearchaeota archaeon]|tara:strand:- start:4059 stop:4418 length:360 start_codon:yes stop_codon:yes gene_type:complete
MKHKWKKPIVVPDGVHAGKIVQVDFEETPYEYTRIYVKFDNSGEDIILKYSCPTNLSETSKLGQLLISFGIEYQADGEVDIREELLSKEVVFQTQMKPSSKNPKLLFAEIIDDTLKLAG